MNIKQSIQKEYFNQINMSYRQLREWSKNPLSLKASLTREPLDRNLRLLSKNKNRWSEQDVKDAIKTISYLKRAKKIKRSKKEYFGYTKNEIALKNWGYDVKK